MCRIIFVVLKTEREQVGHVFHSVRSRSSQSHVDGSTFGFNSRALSEISRLEEKKFQEHVPSLSFTQADACASMECFHMWSEIPQRPAVCWSECCCPALCCQLLICLTFWHRALFFIYFLQPPQHQLLFLR